MAKKTRPKYLDDCEVDFFNEDFGVANRLEQEIGKALGY